MENDREPVTSVDDTELDSMILKLDKPHIASAVISEARRQGVSQTILVETVSLWQQEDYERAGALLNGELIALKKRQQWWEL